MIGEDTVQLVDLASEEVPWIIGGKADGLRRLAVRGLPVPAGCVIPAEADDDDVERLAAEISRMWAGSLLAVRSSGIEEDSAEASYAGQFETVLGVEANPADIVGAVHRVRASVTAPHVASYAHESDPRMPVLVMPMIDAAAAGIAFTRDPVSGEQKVVVEAVAGVADRLAAGDMTGERWVVEDEPLCLDDRGVLDAATAAAVAELALQVEDYEGKPQDIEWAVGDGVLYLLQARPITTLDGLEPVPIDDEIPPGPWEWDSTHSRSPVSPLLADVFPEGMKRGSRLLSSEYGVPLDHLAIRAINGYFYIQMVPPVGNPGTPLPPAPIARLLFRIVPSLRRREKAARRTFAERTYQQWHDRWRTERRPAVERTLSDWFDLELGDLSNVDLAELFERAVELVRDTFAWNMVTDPAYLVPLADLHHFVSAHFDAGLEMTLRLLAGSSRSEYRQSVSALSEMVTPAVRELVERGGDGLFVDLERIDPAFATAFRSHQRRHGTTILGFDFDQPTYLEDPIAELLLIANLPPEEGDPSTDAAGLASELAEKLPPDARARFEMRLAEARNTYWIREEGNAVLFTVIGALRLVMLEVGRRLVAADQAERADHAVFLTTDEITTWLREPTGITEIIRTRRSHRRWATQRRPPVNIGEIPPPPGPESLPPSVGRIMEVFQLVIAHDQRPSDLPGEVDGVAASPGVHTGPVRVVRGPHEFSRVIPGDVLVAPLTTSSWEVLFPHIGALVTEGGGLLSHPAIVAREYRLPAIVGCEGATTRFADGELVTVDGRLGTVTPVRP